MQMKQNIVSGRESAAKRETYSLVLSCGTGLRDVLYAASTVGCFFFSLCRTCIALLSTSRGKSRH